MASVDGKWNCSVDSPMGAQEFVLTVASDGQRFTGRAEGGLGSMEIADGDIAGDTLKWPMRVTKPMTVTLNCTATVSGDSLEGKVSAGIFGSFPIKGVRG